MSRGRRPGAAALAAQVLDHLDTLDRAARHGEQATYAAESLRLRELLVRAMGGRPEAPGEVPEAH